MIAIERHTARPSQWVVDAAAAGVQMFGKTHGRAIARHGLPVEWFVTPAWLRVHRLNLNGRIPELDPHGLRFAKRAAWLGCRDELRDTTAFRRRRKWGLTLQLEPEMVDPTTLDRGPATDCVSRAQSAWAEYAPRRRNLSWRTRLWFYLWAVEGWPMRAIAEVWGVSEAMVSLAFTRGRQFVAEVPT